MELKVSDKVKYIGYGLMHNHIFNGDVATVVHIGNGSVLCHNPEWDGHAGPAEYSQDNKNNWHVSIRDLEKIESKKDKLEEIPMIEHTNKTNKLRELLPEAVKSAKEELKEKQFEEDKQEALQRLSEIEDLTEQKEHYESRIKEIEESLQLKRTSLATFKKKTKKRTVKKK